MRPPQDHPIVKKTSQKESTRDEPSFEQSLSALEEVVARMESESLPLDDLISSYEEGARLLALCRNRLDHARQRVEAITSAEDGTAALSPLDPPEQPASRPGDALF